MVFQKKVKEIVEQMEEEEQEVPQKKVSKQVEAWKVMQVPSTFEPAVVNEETEEVLTQLQATAKILNELRLIRKALGE